MRNSTKAALQRLGIIGRADVTAPADTLRPPSRAEVAPVTTREAIAVPAMYRALQVLATSASQLALDVKRGGVLVQDVPSIINKPDVAMTRDDWPSLGSV